MKKFCFSVFVLFALGMGAAASEPLNLRVVWSEDPQHAAVVVWDSDELMADASLLYGTTSRKIGPLGLLKRKYANEAAQSESGLYPDREAKKPKKSADDWVSPGASAPLYYHQVKLENLEPSTVYFLAVKTENGIGREFHFKTAPEDGEAFKLIYGGDSRTHIDVARRMNEWIADLVVEDDSIIGLLHGGDYADTPRRELWIDWLDAYSRTTTKDGKLLPIIPIIGNHDVIGESPIFRQAYGYPGGTNDYYTCRLTPSIGILCLNTEISAEGNQRVFLQEELESLKEDEVKWQLAAFHKPAFPAIKKPSSAKVSWVPLFEEFDIDLVLESDGHCIKRTVPIRGDEESDDGIVYLGEGGYGAPQREPKADRWYLQGDNAFASKGDHVMMLEFDGSTIRYEAILDTGEVVDKASFQARR
ncbi:purple acid phosphatase family protein [Pelagicoccus mobilis]|uniref:Metallophosphoesterase family protein n=1 Tax=Pelagicoccus mobilis TaxID=415221 RepID=A0A934S044_9BACT|nr:metallophosphoesterase family protein [Pelagicoccus mobilis]MBK1879851.1 metallophosphoesterase family protein [Pelagicoccus mobilis]